MSARSGDEGVAGGGGDRDVDGLAGVSGVERQEDAVEAGRAPEHAIVAAREAGDEDALAAADLGLMRGAGVLLLEIDDVLQAPALGVVVDVVAELAGGVGDAAVAVAEHEGAIELDLAHEREGLLMIGLGLAAEADHEVGAEGEAGHGGAQLGDEGEVLAAGVAALHGAEHGVAAGLGREVDVVADLAIGVGGGRAGGPPSRAPAGS